MTISTAALPSTVSLVALNVADVALTRLALAHGAHEANPIMASLITSPHGFWVKVLVPLVLAALAIRAGRPLVIAYIAALYALVVLSNVAVLGAQL